MDSINTERSYTEYEVTEPTTDFAIGFDNYSGEDKDAIHVTLNGVNLDNLDYTVVRKNAQVIEVTPAIESGVVRLQRETYIDQAFHTFTAGALFSPKSMDENFAQVRRSQQEVHDGFTFLAENTDGVVAAADAATARANAAAEVAETVDVVELQADLANQQADLDAQKFDTGITVTAKNGGIERSQAGKNSDTVSVKDYGAIGDGVLHPLSERFNSLIAANIAYATVNITSLDMSIDTAAIQAALNTERSVHIPTGIFVCNDELFIKTHGQNIFGTGRGAGGNITRYLDWKDQCTILFDEPVNPAVRYVKTRALPRLSFSDPQDAPLSAAINIQGEGVILRDFAVKLAITGVPVDVETDSPTNYGADWDVGIFSGCRANVVMTNVASLGYWRKASIYFDVTRAKTLDEFPNHRGEYPTRGTVTSGSDGCQLHNVLTFGGLWGVFVQGAKGIDGGGYTDGEQYYCSLTNQVVSASGRGVAGFSDFLAVSCDFFGCEHHTRRRMVDIASPPNVELGEGEGGSLSIDGLAGNASGSLQGHRFISCRFSTWSPFQIRLNHSHRDTFIACQHENHSYKGLSTTGAELPNTALNYYGMIAKTKYTAATKLISASATPKIEYFTYGVNDASILSDSTDTRSSAGNFYGKDYNVFGYGGGGSNNTSVTIKSGATGASILGFGTAANLFDGTLRYYHTTGVYNFRSSQSTATSGTVLEVIPSGGATILKTFGNLRLQPNNLYVTASDGSDAFSVFGGSKNANFGGNIYTTSTGKLIGTENNPWGSIHLKDAVYLNSPDGSSWKITVSNTGVLTTTKV